VSHDVRSIVASLAPQSPRPRLDVAERVGDVVFPDPYRDLEDQDRSVAAWQQNQDRAARAHLAAIPERHRVERLVEREFGATQLELPLVAGGRWFTLQRRGLLDGDVIRVSPCPQTTGRVVVAAAEIGIRGRHTIEWQAPAPSGRLLAFGLSDRGDQHPTLRLVELPGGRLLDLQVPFASPCAWLPAGDAFYCSAGDTRASETPVKELLLVRVGGRAERVPMPAGISASEVRPSVSEDGRYLTISAGAMTPRVLYVQDRASGAWIPALPERPDVVFDGDFVGGRYFAVTTLGAPRGRLVAAAIDDLSAPERWSEVAAESDAVMRSVAPAGDRLLLFEYLSGKSRLRLLSLDGRQVTTVPLPGEGLVSRTGRDVQHVGADAPAAVTAREIVFRHAGVEQRPALLRFRYGAEAVELVRGTGQPTGLATSRGCARAPDGRPVEYELVQGTQGAAEPSPTLLVAYGGWNAIPPYTVGYLAMLAPFVRAGGRLTFAHVRGEGTFGADQWEAGRGRYKQRTVDDLVAVAEHLVSDGVTAHGQLGLFGASNGAVIAGAALTQRPELFRAVVALVPIFDLCRAIRERTMQTLSAEYGDPRVERDAMAIRQHSPYHNVVRGVPYPATLVVCGGRDALAAPWHGRKMVAALQEANTGPHPVLLRVHDDYGHDTTAQASPAWIVAEWLAFLMHELGVLR
jgi:prolyl oligopeptidase